MLQTFTTMVSVLLSAGATGIIAASILEDRVALRMALVRRTAGAAVPLPPRTHRVAGPRAARFIRMSAPASPRRAAA